MGYLLARLRSSIAALVSKNCLNRRSSCQVTITRRDFARRKAREELQREFRLRCHDSFLFIIATDLFSCVTTSLSRSFTATMPYDRDLSQLPLSSLCSFYPFPFQRRSFEKSFRLEVLCSPSELRADLFAD